MAESVYTFPEEVELVAHDPDTGEEKRHWSFAEIVSVFASEVYSALAVNLKPEFKAVLPSWEDDYHGEQRLERNGIPYRVIRAYETKEGYAELTCTRLKSHVSDSGTGGST